MSFLKVEKRDRITILTMMRPEQRNALTEAAHFHEFVDVCASIDADSDCAAVVLTGAGSAFCAGGNVKDMRARQGLFAGSPMQVRDNYRQNVQRVPLALYYLEVPTIAAVNGPAVGAGCDLACMCDLRIGSEAATFAESFVRLGLIPGDGGAWLLQRIVGLPKACEMTFTGEAVSARDALACGLVQKVVPPAELMAAALDLAGRIAANPPSALRMAKKLIRQAQQTSLQTALDVSAAFQALAHHSEAHEKAVAAKPWIPTVGGEARP
jgi:enoyl-CoA hydratase/carnithine racemase